MSKEKILVVSDTVGSPTGFGANAESIGWMLSKEYDVHFLGLQSQTEFNYEINSQGEKRTVKVHPNLPRARNVEWDFGFRSLPILLDRLKPDILLTINDIQMVQHIPDILYQRSVNVDIMDLPAKQMISRDAIYMEIDREIERYKEKYPLNCKWIMYAPQDGQPPMPQWKYIYTIADKVVAFAKYGQNVFKEYLNMDVPYIYHGIDTELFVPKEKTMFKDKFVIGNLNRNQPRKQPVRTMKAFAKFAKDKPDVLLHMQMDWNDRFGWPLQYFAQLFRINNKMINPMPVGLQKKQMPSVYQQWDLNANSHGGEGFSITTIEGFGCAKPSVATNYSTLQELTLEGDPSPRGMCVPYKDLYWEKLDVAAVQRAAIDEDKMAEAFEYYYQNRDVLIKHGNNSRLWAEKNVSLKVLEPQWISLIKDTIAH